MHHYLQPTNLDLADKKETFSKIDRKMVHYRLRIRYVKYVAFPQIEIDGSAKNARGGAYIRNAEGISNRKRIYWNGQACPE